MNNLPHALLEAHRWGELETAAQKALITAPANVPQKLNLAIARICLGKSTNIREEIDRTLGPNPARRGVLSCRMRYQTAGDCRDLYKTGSGSVHERRAGRNYIGADQLAGYGQHVP